MATNAGKAHKRAFPIDDLKAGSLVFLIALPLCLGIAMASGFPPVAGVTTAIVGGIVATFLGSARLTIKGPAAGLIVIALGAVQELGHGNAVDGYRRALAVGVMAAVVQIIFALMRAASIGVAMSPSVIHGMLAAIGVIIISKQAHTVLGATPRATEPLELLAEIPHSIVHDNPEIMLIGLLSLLILFGMPYVRAGWARRVPAPMIVLAVAVPLGLWFDLDHKHVYTLWAQRFAVGPEYLVQLPSAITDAIVFPDFSLAMTPLSLKYVVMFALVGTIESTLSVLAVDGMDPQKRASNLNRDLLAIGTGNLVAALIGGLPMISEIVRSKANVDAGAQSRWSNFFHGVLLLGFVALAPGLLHEIPLAALAAMLIYTGARLAAPGQFIHAKQVGSDQLALFLITLVVTLATDLLIGVAVGLTVKIALHLFRGALLRDLFYTRMEHVKGDKEWRLTLHGTAAFLNLLSVRKALAQVPDKIDRVVIDVGDVCLVDHTFLSRIAVMADEWPHAVLQIVGLDALSPVSVHKYATRRKPT